MNHVTPLTLITAGIVSVITLSQISHAQATHTGTVERVWEDGFRLHADDQTLWVDTSDLYGENTPNYIAVGDQIKVTGEFERIEFDASSISVVTPYK